MINGLSFALKKEGYEIDVARTTLEADTLWVNDKYDLLPSHTINMKQEFEVIVIGRQKEVCYLLQKKDSDLSEIAGKKEALSRQGYLVVTIIDGGREKGMADEAIVFTGR